MSQFVHFKLTAVATRDGEFGMVKIRESGKKVYEALSKLVAENQPPKVEFSKEQIAEWEAAKGN